jgi:hypothetical protein
MGRVFDRLALAQSACLPANRCLAAALLAWRSLRGDGKCILHLRVAAAAQPLQFGLIPVFLTSDLELLGNLAAYLKRAMSRDVQLVT